MITLSEARAALKTMANPEWPNYESAKQMLEAFIEQVEGVKPRALASVDAAAETRPADARQRFDQPMPGHWDTSEGLSIANEYAGKSRADLMMGDRSDFSLANAQYLIDRNDLRLIHFQTAAKERIRWLSVQLAATQSALNKAVGGGVPAAPQTEAKPLGGTQ
jgi:hypothetical protein